MAEPRLLTCVDCGAEFEFGDRDAVFYQDKGWEPPRRCKGCRVKKNPEAKPRFNSGGHRIHDSEKGDALFAESANVPAAKFKVNCATCGIETLVPFKPDSNRPVYCRSCLNKVRVARRSST